MAIVTHNTSKNANYSDALEYYSYKHTEDQRTGHYEPVLDEHGLKQERENFAVCCISSEGEEIDPEMWASRCSKTNFLFGKNQKESDRKSHEYIISHPEEDRERMSMNDLVAEGKAFAERYLKGYDCLIAVHRDTDNDHIHISINSVRDKEREEQDWMMRDRKTGETLDCEKTAGGKHQDSPQLRRNMNEWLKDYTRAHGYTVKDNNAIADVHRAERHGSKNEQMKTALLEAAGRSKNMQELQRIMKQDYNMELKIRGNTFSVQHPDSQKAVRLKTLGLDPAELARRFDTDKYVYNKQAEEARRKAEEEEKERRARQRKEEEEERRRYYGDRRYRDSQTGKLYFCGVYDENGRRRTALELTFVLALVIMRKEEYLWEPSHRKLAEGETQSFFASTNWKIQNSYDAMCIAREENIKTPEQLINRLDAAGKEYSKVKTAYEKASQGLEENQDLFKAIQVYKIVNQDRAMPEGERKEARMREDTAYFEGYEAAKQFMKEHGIETEKDVIAFDLKYDKFKTDFAKYKPQFEEQKNNYHRLKLVEKEYHLAREPKHIYGPEYSPEEQKRRYADLWDKEAQARENVEPTREPKKPQPQIRR